MLEDLHLIQCSLLQGEQLNVVTEGKALNHRAVDAFCLDFGLDRPVSFEVAIRDRGIQFSISILSDGDFEISVTGTDLSRVEHERWQEIIREKKQEVEGTEFPIYQIVCLNLLPLLHDSAKPPNESQSKHQVSPAPEPLYHTLLTSHHLISPKKRRSLQNWSSSLDITGFAKIGYPGIIYAQGYQSSILEFITNIKSMQWLALKLHFTEAIPVITLNFKEGGPGWVEYQKIGEVMETMRKIEREGCLIDVGIGSAALG